MLLCVGLLSFQPSRQSLFKTLLFLFDGLVDSTHTTCFAFVLLVLAKSAFNKDIFIVDRVLLGLALIIVLNLNWGVTYFEGKSSCC